MEPSFPCASLSLLLQESLEEAQKTFPWSGVKIKMAPKISPVSDPITKTLKKLSQVVSVRPVNRLDQSNLHPLAYQLDRHLSPVNSIKGQV